MASLTIRPDLADLARLEERRWSGLLADLYASGVPTCDDGPQTVEELEERQEAIRGRLQELDNEFRGQAFPDDAREEYNGLNEEYDGNERLVGELRTRQERVRALHDQGERNREQGATFNVPSPSRGEDVWDYSHVRSASSLEGQRQMLRDQAMRALERSVVPHPQVDEDKAKGHLERLLSSIDDEHSTVARRLLNTGSPLYHRAFSKAIAGAPLTGEEQRALGLTNTAGGYAVPFTLDPTIIPTSNGAVNPYRRVARSIQITGTTWQGITASGVTVTRRSEADEMADNAPTIAQPSATPQRVDAFVPFSFEIGQDWASMQADFAQLLSDGKDEEEAASFTTGTGVPPAAQGILTGATVTVAANGVASFAVGDLYKVEEALPPRYRPLAQWVASRNIYNRIRQFGDQTLWTESLRDGLANGRLGNTGYNLIGYPANEASAMPAVLTTGTKIAIFGDFRHFAIVDRIGMDVELVPHLFGTNRRPTGQRGLLAFWRNTSVVLVPGAFRALVTG